jgi:Skp family chaperone for outer membrane proteins
MKTRWTMVLTVVLGVVAGAVGGAFGGRALQSAPTGREAVAADEQSIQARQAHADTSTKALRDLQRETQDERLRHLEDRMAHAELAREERPGQPETTSPRPDLATSREQTLSDWEDRLADHEAEAKDPAWSTPAEKALNEDVFAIAAQAQVRVLGSDCKSKTCTATVEWKNYGTAVDNFGTLLHNPYQNGCARAVILPEPDKPGAPYRATILFDCSASRNPG